MQPRPLETENRILRSTAASQLRVSLGRAVKEMAQTPMTGSLVLSKIKQESAAADAFSVEERETLNALSNAQYEIEWNLSTETDPAVRDNLLLQLETIYDQNKTKKDLIYQQAISDGRLASQEDLTQMYGDRLTFDGPMAPEKARLLYEGAKEQYIRELIISRSPEGIGPGIAKFGGAMIAMATDPLELATMFIPVVGQAGKVSSIARFGRIKGRAAVGAVEGTAGSLMTEPLYYSLSKDQQLDYTMTEALFNVGAGFFLGGAIGTAAGFYSRLRNPDSDVPTPDFSQKPDGETISPEELSAVKKQVSETYNATGKRLSYEAAVRQFVTDQDIDVSMLVPKSVKRPTPLSVFIKRNGGINDDDPTFRGELKSRDIKPVRGGLRRGQMVYRSMSNPESQMNLDDMAEAAFEAGYIDKRNPNMLMEAIDSELSDNYVFAKQDLEEAEDWRRFNESSTNREAEISRREDIRSELEEEGVINVSDDEIAIISQKMTESEDAITAYTRVKNVIEESRAAKLADYASQAKNYTGVDLEASARFGEIEPESDLDVQNEQFERVVAQMEETEGLTDYARSQREHIERLTAEAKAYRELADVAARCEATR